MRNRQWSVSGPALVLMVLGACATLTEAPAVAPGSVTVTTRVASTTGASLRIHSLPLPVVPILSKSEQLARAASAPQVYGGAPPPPTTAPRQVALWLPLARITQASGPESARLLALPAGLAQFDSGAVVRAAARMRARTPVHPDATTAAQAAGGAARGRAVTASPPAAASAARSAAAVAVAAAPAKTPVAATAAAVVSPPRSSQPAPTVAAAPLAAVAATLAVAPPQLSGDIEPAAGAPTTAPDEQAFARVGDGIELALPGAGWIYLGDLQGQASGVTYSGRSIETAATLFSFRAARIGDFLLEFQLQDHRTGDEQRKTVLVSVVAPLEFARILANGGVAASGRTQPVIPTTDEADRLFAAGLDDLALSAYLAVEIGLDGGPGRGPATMAHVNGRIAELQFRAGDFALATRYWRRNLELASDLGGASQEAARTGLVRVALARGDVESLEPLIDHLLQLPASGRGEIQRDAARLLQDRERWESAVLVLRDYLERYAGVPDVAEALFRLGGVYEANWRGRDLRRSRDHYLQVQQRFPVSAFALPSRERVRYLDRHYFVVN